MTCLTLHVLELVDFIIKYKFFLVTLLKIKSIHKMYEHLIKQLIYN